MFVVETLVWLFNQQCYDRTDNESFNHIHLTPPSSLARLKLRITPLNGGRHGFQLIMRTSKHRLRQCSHVERRLE